MTTLTKPLTAAAAIAALLFSSCEAATLQEPERTPPEGEVLSYLESQTRSRYLISNFRSESYPNPDGRTGAISCAGTFRLKPPIYRKADEAADSVARAAGIDRAERWMYPINNRHFYTLQLTPGSPLEFRCELGFAKHVDGWHIFGKVDYFDRDFMLSISDLLDSDTLPSDALQVGSDEYDNFIKQMTDERLKRESAPTKK